MLISLKDCFEMYLNFFLSECTHLRYFVPIIEEASRRNYKSRFFVGYSGKYNCALNYGNFDYISALAEILEVEIFPIEELKEHTGITFFVEPQIERLQFASSRQKIVVISSMTDFTLKLRAYENAADHIFLPSKFLAEFYDVVSPKNVYLGSPKYDVVLEEEEVLKKYNLSKGRYALIIAPRTRDLHKFDLTRLYTSLNKAGYQTLVKTRGKDPLPRSMHGDRYFTDPSWYPHTTMELIHISDIVVNFSSTSIKECVLQRTPVVNYHIKPFEQPLKFMYEHSYCESLGSEFDENILLDAINRLTSEDLDDTFNKSIQKYLFTGNSSKKILDYLGVL